METNIDREVRLIEEAIERLISEGKSWIGFYAYEPDDVR